jgi:hypothetical protein
LKSLDPFVKREHRCKAYLRYVDGMARLSHSKRELWRRKQNIIEHLAILRLTVHPQAQVTQVENGIPWLGFIVYPNYRRVKARNVRNFGRRLQEGWNAYCAGEMTFAEFDSRVQGWINHVRYADSWSLRQHLLGKPLKKP